jgi:hypothetical protein
MARRILRYGSGRSGIRPLQKSASVESHIDPDAALQSTLIQINMDGFLVAVTA